MIKFFRKIRQKLLSENRFGKYLTYAAGEILLVVIGILIALQINNWNNERINRAQSREYMESLIEDINSNIQQYEDNIESYSSDIRNNKRLFFKNEYQELEADSILKLVNSYYQVNRITKQTYEKIKNAGLAESLGSDEVNKAINDYYGLQIKYYEGLLNWDQELTSNHYEFWFYNQDFESGTLRSYASESLPYITSEEQRKKDLIALIESIKGRNLLRGAIERHEHTLRRVNEIKSEAENVVRLIKKELQKP